VARKPPEHVEEGACAEDNYRVVKRVDQGRKRGCEQGTNATTLGKSAMGQERGGRKVRGASWEKGPTMLATRHENQRGEKRGRSEPEGRKCPKKGSNKKKKPGKKKRSNRRASSPKKGKGGRDNYGGGEERGKIGDKATREKKINTIRGEKERYEV